MLYIHIPYCHRKCSYCAFYSVVTTSGRKEYIDALCREIRLRANAMSLKTIYFGGGTPSLLTIEELSQIKEAIAASFDVSNVVEVTIEANPEDVTEDWLSGLRKMNFFNRISIGVQSFNDDDLHVINRRHTASQAVDAIRLARRYGFRNISIDLIMGLPGQTLQGWQRNLQILGAIKPAHAITHLSCYELTVEPGTILDRQIATGRVVLPGEETVEAEYQYLQQWCKEYGFRQYEVSNFARKGFRSRHNSRYWDRTPYIGVGAAAHSFDGLRRRWNNASVALYVAGARDGSIPCEEETLTDIDAFNEYVMTALRTTAGIRKSMIGKPYRKVLAESIKPFISNGLVEESATAYRPTERGLLQADGIAAALFLS